MNAIYKNRCYKVEDVRNLDVALTPIDGGEPVDVELDDPDLIIDPTDEQWFACENAPHDVRRKYAMPDDEELYGKDAARIQQDRAFEDQFEGLRLALQRTRDALHVMVLTPHIRHYLEANDPKALEQALTALLEGK